MTGDGGGYGPHYAHNEFSFKKRKFTITVNMHECVKDGRKPSIGEIFAFLKDKVGANIFTIEGIEINELVLTLFVKFFTEEQTIKFFYSILGWSVDVVRVCWVVDRAHVIGG